MLYFTTVIIRSFFIDTEGDSFLNLKGSIGWSESTLNKGVLATRGHSQSLVLETTTPGSDLSFFKLDCNRSENIWMLYPPER